MTTRAKLARGGTQEQIFEGRVRKWDRTWTPYCKGPLSGEVRLELMKWLPTDVRCSEKRRNPFIKLVPDPRGKPYSSKPHVPQEVVKPKLTEITATEKAGGSKEGVVKKGTEDMEVDEACTAADPESNPKSTEDLNQNAAPKAELDATPEGPSLSTMPGGGSEGGELKQTDALQAGTDPVASSGKGTEDCSMPDASPVGGERVQATGATGGEGATTQDDSVAATDKDGVLAGNKEQSRSGPSSSPEAASAAVGAGQAVDAGADKGSGGVEASQSPEGAAAPMEDEKHPKPLNLEESAAPAISPSVKPVEETEASPPPPPPPPPPPSLPPPSSPHPLPPHQ